jgi:hypothetical protein
MNRDEVTQATDLLRKLAPGFLPYPIFEQIARLVALPIVEFIPLRLSESDGVDVLLIHRPDDDPLWPGMLHTPGTVVRATDLHQGKQDDWLAFERILHDELKDTSIGAPHYVGSMFHDSKRGAELAQLYWVEVIGEPAVGKFYNAYSLPSSLIDSQRAFIDLAASNFQQYKMKES